MTSQQWQAKAVSQVGSNARYAVFRLELPLATSGGTFTLTFNGRETASIAFNAAAEVVQSALEALPTLGTGNVVVTGLKAGPYDIALTGELAGQSVPDGTFLADGGDLVPAAGLTVILKQPGRPDTMAADADSLWNDYPDYADELRFLYVKRDLLRAALADAAQLVDSRDGDAEAKDSQRFAHLQTLLNQTEAAILGQGQLDSAGARNQTYTTAPAKTTPNGLPFGQLQRPNGPLGGVRGGY